MTALSLGATAAGDPLAVDLDALVGGHAAIVANSGGGKSGLLRRLLEVSHRRIQHIVLDIEDEFYTLRERFDDYVIVGGEGADAPVAIDGAADLARTALEHGFSLIVQLNDFGARAPEFVARFLEGLMSAPRAHWHPLLVVLDEVQRFVSPKVPTAAMPAVTDLVNRGRKRGFTAVLASLRLADAIAPEIRAMVNNWLLGRTGQSLDRNAMADQLGMTPKEGREQLRAMEPRHFWGFGPAIAAEPVLFHVDDVETTPVKSGQARIPTPPAPEALREILAGLATAEANPDEVVPADPTAAYERGSAVGGMLKERDDRIAELEGLLAKAEGRSEQLFDELRRFRRMSCEAYDTLRKLVITPSEALTDRATPEPDDQIPEAKTGIAAADAFPPVAAGRRVTPSGEGPIRGLRALEALASAGDDGLSEVQWALVAGLSRRGGTWSTYKSSLRREGLIEQRGGTWFATWAGVEALDGQPPLLPTFGPELARFWAERIPGVRRMVDVLVKRWPHFTSRDALAADLGMAAGGGTFGTYLGRLRSAELLEEKNKRLRLAPAVMDGPPA